MSKTKATRKWRAAFFWTALMLMLAGPAEISYAQGTAVTAKPAVPGAIAPAKPAVQGPAVPAKPVTQATPAPQAPQEQAQAYRYNPDVRIDPFKPFVDLNAAAKKKMEKSKPLSPLQQAGIEAFTLVGIIEGNKRRRAMVQDAVNRWWWKCLAMFGPPDADSPNSAIGMRYGIKRFSNDDLRQKFVDATVPQAQILGVTLPDPDLKWNEARGHYDYGPIDWDEFWRTVNGDGPCNKERLATRVKADRDGQWVRDAALAHARKRAARESKNAKEAA